MKCLIKKFVEKYVIQYLYKYLLLVLLSAVSINTVIAQDLPTKYFSKYITINTSNTHPKINEVVDFNISLIAPAYADDYYINISVYNNAHYKVERGKLNTVNIYKLKKTENTHYKFSIRFLEKRMYYITVSLMSPTLGLKGFVTQSKIFVENAPFETSSATILYSEIKKLKDNIKILKTKLETERNKEITPDKYQAPITDKGGVNLTLVSPSPISHPLYLPFGIRSKNTRQQDTPPFRGDTLSYRLYQVYQILNNEHNSLIRTIDSVKEKRNRYRIKIKNEKKSKNKTINGSEFNLNNRKESNLIIPDVNVEDTYAGDVYVLVNEDSQELWFTNSFNQIVDMNWSVEPSSLGYITENNTTHKVIFHANGSVANGKIKANYNNQAYYYLNLYIIDKFDVSGTFKFETKDSQLEFPQEFYVVLYDRVNNIALDYVIAFQGNYLFKDVTNVNAAIYLTSDAVYATVFNDATLTYIYTSGFYYDVPLTTFILSSDNTANIPLDTVSYASAPQSTGAFNILNTVERGHRRVYDDIGVDLPKLKIQWDTSNVEGVSNYSHVNELLTLAGQKDEDQWDEDVILHEYGHFVQNKISIGYPTGAGVQHHSWSSITNEGNALTEGWATFFSCAVQEDENYIDLTDYGSKIAVNHHAELPSYHPRDSKCEGSVTSALWDIYDSNNETNSGTNPNNDNVTQPLSHLLTSISNPIFNGHSPYSYYEFSIGWYESQFASIKDISAAQGLDAAPYSIHMDVPVYTMEQSYYSGAATTSMILSYLGVSQSQSAIQNAGGAGTADMNGPQAESAVTTYQPAPYTFGRGTFQDINSATAFLAKWVSYDISVDKPLTGSQPDHAPGMIPLDGSYNNWAVVNGVETSAYPYPDGAVYTLYGFWITEPYRSSGNIQQLALAKSSALIIPSYLGGGESYLTAAAFQTRYKSIAGQWTAICEPPEGALGNPIISAPIPVTAESDSQIVQIVLAALNNQPGLGDVIKIRHILGGKIPGNITFVNRLGVDDPYYIIPFNKAGKTYLGVIIDGYGFYLEEAALPSEAVDYHLMKKQKAINLLVSQGYISHSQNPEGKLVYSPFLSINQYYPAWEITAEGQIFYVTQNGEVKLPNDLPKIQQPKDITLPHIFSLGQNYPNPFNPTTQITYQIPKDGFVSLIVYNTLGQKIVSLVNQNQVSGKYTVNFNADNLPSGMYIYKIKSGNFSEVKKMILLK